MERGHPHSLTCLLHGDQLRSHSFHARHLASDKTLTSCCSLLQDLEPGQKIPLAKWEETLRDLSS
jgi:hypothetical protein